MHNCGYTSMHEEIERQRSGRICSLKSLEEIFSIEECCYFEVATYYVPDHVRATIVTADVY